MNKEGDKTGKFRLEGIPAGHYIFVAKVRGFREIVRPIAVEAGKESNLGMVLLPAMAVVTLTWIGLRLRAMEPAALSSDN